MEFADCAPVCIIVGERKGIIMGIKLLFLPVVLGIENYKQDALDTVRYKASKCIFPEDMTGQPWAGL